MQTTSSVVELEADKTSLQTQLDSLMSQRQSQVRHRHTQTHRQSETHRLTYNRLPVYRPSFTVSWASANHSHTHTDTQTEWDTQTDTQTDWQTAMSTGLPTEVNDVRCRLSIISPPGISIPPAGLCFADVGRLLRVDLIKWFSNVRPPVRTSVHKKNLRFQWNWYVGRGRRVMNDGMQYDPIQGQCQGHEPLKVGNSAIYLLPHL